VGTLIATDDDADLEALVGDEDELAEAPELLPVEAALALALSEEEAEEAEPVMVAVERVEALDEADEFAEAEEEAAVEAAEATDAEREPVTVGALGLPPVRVNWPL